MRVTIQLVLELPANKWDSYKRVSRRVTRDLI